MNYAPGHHSAKASVKAVDAVARTRVRVEPEDVKFDAIPVGQWVSMHSGRIHGHTRTLAYEFYA